MAVVRDIAPWDQLLAQGRADGRLVTTVTDPGRPGDPVPIPEELHPLVVGGLRKRGIDELWSHQAAAVDAAWTNPVIVTTGTASGKSMCFNLPVLDVLCRDAKAKALYLYPTKALAQDQARAIASFGVRHARPAIYDGDTPREQRREIRRRANVVLTNPDMLHMGILPHHDAWAELFANLAVVVVDEAHVYRGVFGSHVANVLRRLRRVAEAYGTHPRFLLTSATVANPVELAERLTGLERWVHVAEDGSPAARRTIAMWNPPVTDPGSGARRSALAEASEVLAMLIAGGARTICFMKSRKAVELVHRFTRGALEELGRPELAGRLSPYRAGYTASQRREIEGKLVRGELLGVVTTDALELGIDIGSLDAAVCVGFPGTVASLRQMWGRAGRRGRGLALYVAGDDALDQFFCRHPEEFLDRAVEAAILDHENPDILRGHLLCAAHEGPIGPVDGLTLSDGWRREADALVRRGHLRETRGRFVLRHGGEVFPAGEVPLRSAGADGFHVIDACSGEILGTVDGGRAFWTIHPGAVYLHRGRAYEVLELDLDVRRALVRPFDGGYSTQPKRETSLEILRLLDRRPEPVLGVRLSLAAVSVTEHVVGYQMRRLSDGEPIGIEPLDLPPTRFTTQAIYYELPDLLLRGFDLGGLLGALHAAEHAQIAVLPLLAMCDRWDIGGLSTASHDQTNRPTIFIYDGHEGGIGIARQAFREFGTLVSDAHRLIAECGCDEGCPSCVQSPKCGNLNEPLAKDAARTLLGAMLRAGRGVAAGR